MIKSNQIIVFALILMISVQAISVQIMISNVNSTSIPDVENSTFTGSNNNTRENTSEKYPQHTSPMSLSESSPQIAFPSDWLQGESVHIEHVFPTQYPVYSDVILNAKDQTGNSYSAITGVSQIWNAKSDDGLYLVSEAEYHTTDQIVDHEHMILFEKDGLGGNRYYLYYDFKIEITLYDDNAGTFTTYTSSAILSYYTSDITFALIGLGFQVGIDKDYNTLNTQVHIVVNSDHKYEPGDAWPITSYSYIYKTVLKVDYVYLKGDNLEENIRSEYKYSSPTILNHQLEIKTNINGEELHVFTPLSWNLTTISPEVTYVWDNTNKYWVINTWYPTTYTITFISGDGYGVDYQRKPQLLALREVSSDYLQDISFENGKWSDDWKEYSGLGFDTVSLDTSIVFDGSFSVKLGDTDSSTDIFELLENLSPGYYYISFNYYVETWVSGTLQLKLYTNRGNEYPSLDTTVLNRWQSFFYYYHVDQEPTGASTNFQIQFSAGIGTIYFDNFKIYRSSSQLQTVGLNQYEISGILRSWDNRQNPPMPNSLVQVQLRSRTENTLVKSWHDVQTDSQGVFSVTYNQELEQKEYEIRVWSWDSYFAMGTLPENMLHITPSRVSGWADVSHTTETISYETSENAIRIQDSTTSTTHDIRFYPTVNWDLREVDFWLISYRSTVSTTLYIDYWTLRTTSTDEVVWYSSKFIDDVYVADPLLRTSYSTHAFDMDSWIVINNWDASNVDFLDFRLHSSSSESLDILISEFRFITAQKTYFTPIPASQKTFEYEQNNEWDFSEGTLESWTYKGGTPTENRVTEFGYTQFETRAGSWDGIYINSFRALGLPNLEAKDGYLTVVIRFWCNVSGNQYYFYTNNYDMTDPHNMAVVTSVANTWITVTDTILFPSGGIDDIRFEARGGLAPYPALVRVDFVRLVHTKSQSYYQGDSYFVADSENSSLTYAVFSDNVFIGHYSDLEIVPANLTASNHNLTLIPVIDRIENFPGVFISGVPIVITYTITESDLTTLTFYDREGTYIDARTFRIYVNSQRIYGDTFIWVDTSQTVNLTITDAWGDIVYQNISEAYERFKDFQVTLYSLKIQNMQENPIWVQFVKQGSGQTFSEWIFPFEVIEYRVMPATYDVTIYYSDVSSNFDVATNGTFVQYSYVVSTDTAIRVTGTSIRDVFNNVISLSQDLDAVNASLTNQILNVNITVTNVNNSISNQIVNVDINLSNVNSSLGQQLSTLSLDLSNVNSTIFNQTLTILSEISNVNSTLFAQTVTILSDLSNVNSTLYAQTLSILADVQNTNSTLYAQTVTILSEIDASNATQVQLVLNMIYSGIVHFDLVDVFGVGLDWNIVKVLVNGSRIYSPDQAYPTGTFLNITVLTFWNASVTQLNITVTATLNQTQDITILVPLGLQYLHNNNDVPVGVTIISGQYNITFVIQSNESMIFWAIKDTYNITVEPIVKQKSNGTYIFNYSKIELTGVSLPTERVLSFSLAMTASKIPPDNNITNTQATDEYLLAWLITTLSVMLVFGSGYLVYKIAGAFAEYLGISLWNLTIGFLTGKKIWKKKEYIISEKPPKGVEYTG